MIKAAPDLLAIASALLPGARLDDAFVAADGNIHDVLLLPGVAAVRVSKRPLAAASMPRGVEVLRQLASLGLPFQVPEPLTPVTMFDDRAAVAVSWIDGVALPEGVGDPSQVALVLEAVRSVPLDSLTALDGRALGPSWSTIIAEEIGPRLPKRWQSEGRRRLDAVLALEPVPDALVHGDLSGSNVHWSATESCSASSTGTWPCPLTRPSTRPRWLGTAGKTSVAPSPPPPTTAPAPGTRCSASATSSPP